MQRHSIRVCAEGFIKWEAWPGERTLSVVHYEFILSKNNAYINFNFKSDEVELWHGWVMMPSRTDFPGLQVFENFTVYNIS